MGVEGWPTWPRTFGCLSSMPSAISAFTMTEAACPLSPVSRAISALDNAPERSSALTIRRSL